MNQYEIIDITTGKVLTKVKAKNRKEAAQQAFQSGTRKFRVRKAG
jgi:hypothetical protein